MEESPAWMVCEDMISRIEAELMSEALELLRSEIDAGRIKVDGSMVTASELTGEAERDLFILDRLLEDEQNMRYRYENLVRAIEEGKETNPEIVGRAEEVKKFLLIVSQISITVKYAKVFSAWFNEAGSQMNVKDPVEILAMTARSNRERRDALEFVTTNRQFIKSEIMNVNEMEMLREAHKRSVG